MWRYVAGAGAILGVAAAATLLLGTRDHVDAALPALSPDQAAARDDDTPLPDSVPEAKPATREQKRFNRYDKDRDGRITRDEYLAQRRKAYARLDTDGDGRLSFDEWAAKATTKFAGADKDRSDTMNAAEFATTAVKRKPRVPTKCPPAQAPREEES